MKVDPKADINGTSFWGVTIKATARQIKAVMGESLFGCNKSSYTWAGVTEDGCVFTIYDWKEGDFSEDVVIEWHIGGRNKESTEVAAVEVESQLTQKV